MNIREPRHYAQIRAEREIKNRHQKLGRFAKRAVIVLLALVLIGGGLLTRPVPPVQAKTILPVVTPEQVALSWPVKGQAAIGVDGQGVLATTAGQTAVPTASVAKIMLALAVLKKYPVQPGQGGPMVPITAKDVELYNKYLGIDGAVVKVSVGEQINLYQALQATLIPSGNNMADSLALWAYGSMTEYHLAANQIAQELGMNQSTFAGDASGFLPETVSTASDLVRLGQAALANPVIKEIVAQPTAIVPVAGEIRNTNFLLGQAGIIGLKSGNTEQAGGCFLFAANRQLANGQTITAIGAVMGAASFGQAATSSIPLLNSFFNGFAEVVVVPKGTEVARYTAPWGGESMALTAADAKLFTWRGSKAAVTVAAKPLPAGSSTGVEAGTINLKSAYGQSSTPLTSTSAIDTPGWQWRLGRH